MTEEQTKLTVSTDEIFGVELALYGLAEALRDGVNEKRFVESFEASVAGLGIVPEDDRRAVYGRLLFLLDGQADDARRAIEWETARHQAALKLGGVVREAIFDLERKTGATVFPIGDSGEEYVVKEEATLAFAPDFNPATLPDAYRRFRLPVFVADAEAIREALERGEKIEGVAILPARRVVRANNQPAQATTERSQTNQ